MSLKKFHKIVNRTFPARARFQHSYQACRLHCCMKRTVSLRSDKYRVVYYLPREVWVAILKMLSFGVLWPLRLVSRTWMELVYAGVTSIGKSESHALSDEHLKRMSSLANLGVNYGNHTISDKGISGLMSLVSLDLAEYLSEGNSPYASLRVTDNGVSCLTNLQWLSLESNHRISDRGISALPNLTTLLLEYNEKISDDAISRLSNLKRLDLTENGFVTNRGISRLVNLTDLRFGLDEDEPLNGFGLTDDGISGLTRLTFLQLPSDTVITDRGVSGLTNLTELDHSFNAGITNNGLKMLTSLTVLDLDANNNITANGISTLTNLTRLGLSDDGLVGDKGITGLASLTELDLSFNSRITDSGISGLTNLRVLDLRTTSKVTDFGLSLLTNLTSLDLRYNQMITNDGVAHLTNLQRIRISSRKYRRTRVDSFPFPGVIYNS